MNSFLIGVSSPPEVRSKSMIEYLYHPVVTLVLFVELVDVTIKIIEFLVSGVLDRTRNHWPIRIYIIKEVRSSMTLKL